jgi:PhoPQ-activated pathogenicity-related protein
MNTFRKPFLAVFFASLLLFVSCSQYDQIQQDSVLDKETISQLEEATLQFLEDVRKNPLKFTRTSTEEYIGTPDILINEAIIRYNNDDLEVYQQNVTNYANWDNNDQLAAIEAIFVVLNTFKNNFTAEDAARFNEALSLETNRGPWWTSLALWGVCATVGLLTAGVAGVACAGLVAARLSYLNYQDQ